MNLWELRVFNCMLKEIIKLMLEIMLCYVIENRIKLKCLM